MSTRTLLKTNNSSFKNLWFCSTTFGVLRPSFKGSKSQFLRDGHGRKFSTRTARFSCSRTFSFIQVSMHDPSTLAFDVEKGGWNINKWCKKPPAPPGMYKTLYLKGSTTYQLVQYFFHQQYQVHMFGTNFFGRKSHNHQLVKKKLLPWDPYLKRRLFWSQIFCINVHVVVGAVVVVVLHWFRRG